MLFRPLFSKPRGEAGFAFFCYGLDPFHGEEMADAEHTLQMVFCCQHKGVDPRERQLKHCGAEEGGGNTHYPESENVVDRARDGITA